MKEIIIDHYKILEIKSILNQFSNLIIQLKYTLNFEGEIKTNSILFRRTRSSVDQSGLDNHFEQNKQKFQSRINDLNLNKPKNLNNFEIKEETDQEKFEDYKLNIVDKVNDSNLSNSFESSSFKSSIQITNHIQDKKDDIRNDSNNNYTFLKNRMNNVKRKQSVSFNKNIDKENNDYKDSNNFSNKKKKRRNSFHMEPRISINSVKSDKLPHTNKSYQIEHQQNTLDINFPNRRLSRRLSHLMDLKNMTPTCGRNRMTVDLNRKVNKRLYKQNLSAKILAHLENIKQSRKTNVNQKRRLKYFPQSFQVDQFDDVKIFNGKKDSQYLLNSIMQGVQISDQSLFNYLWNISLSMILFFQILLFPFENFSEPQLNNNIIYIYIQLGFEWVFIIDVALNFITSQRDQYEHVVKNIKDISLNQLQTWFILDFSSSLPVTTLTQFNIISLNQNQNVQLRLLKLPKQLRIFRGFINIFSSRLAVTLNFDSVITLTNSEYNKYINTFKYSTYFALVSNFLVCQLISFTMECKEVAVCNNWFQYIMRDEYYQALQNDQTWYHSKALQIDSQQSLEQEAEMAFYSFAWDERRLLQQNAWYFVLQTVTTVGQGDISTSNTNERIFRSFVMIIGISFFTMLSSSVLESTITDTFNIYKQNEHEHMIEKLQIKYEMKGNSKRFLNLLGDSVFTENLDTEIRFASMLPKQMSESVLKFIWNIYRNKMPLLRDESMDQFISLMRISQFRRCVFDEIVETGDPHIYIIYSGQIGCYVANLKEQMNTDYLYYKQVGEEIGQNCQIDMPQTAYQNQVQTCSVNSELIRIQPELFLNLKSRSLKGIDQVYEQIIKQLVEMQLMVSLQYSMQKVGHYIDFNWYHMTLSLLKFEPQDFLVMRRLQHNFTEVLPKENKQSWLDSDNFYWQENIVDPDSLKQIHAKVRDISKYILRDQFNDLIVFSKGKTKRSIK